MRVVGQIHFLDISFDVYEESGTFYFLALEVANVLYNGGTARTHHLLRMVSPEYVFTKRVRFARKMRYMKFITREGLYEAFARSYLPQARIWLQIAIKQLIGIERDLFKQFEQMNEESENVYEYDTESQTWYKYLGCDRHGDPIYAEYDVNFNQINFEEGEEEEF